MINTYWLKRLTIALSVFLFSASLFAQEEAAANLDLDAGKSLFRSQCGVCHSTDMVTDATGPALGAVEERWADYPQEDLYRWIRNSQAMIAEGHPKATELWEQWQPTVMTSFLNLTDQEIANILGYIDGVYTGTYGPKPLVTTGGEVAVEEKTG
jgi:mono/diheme cytochrome c family protein